MVVVTRMVPAIVSGIAPVVVIVIVLAIVSVIIKVIVIVFSSYSYYFIVFWGGGQLPNMAKHGETLGKNGPRWAENGQQVPKWSIMVKHGQTW